MFTETEAITMFPTMIWRHHVAPEVVARLKSTMGAKIDELLANRPPGTRHVAHQHPNNYLSGVYYLKASEGAPSIAFLDPRSHVHIISPKVRRDNNYNAGRMNIDVRDGMLIIFPAWLVHEVGENRTDESRISVSFNLMFSSFTEKYSPPKWKGTPVPEE